MCANIILHVVLFCTCSSECCRWGSLVNILQSLYPPAFLYITHGILSSVAPVVVPCVGHILFSFIFLQHEVITFFKNRFSHSRTQKQAYFGFMIIIFAYFFFLTGFFFKKLFIHCSFYVGRTSFRRFSTVLHGNNAVVCLCFRWNPWNNQSLMFFVQTLTLKCCQYRLICHEVERDTQRDKWLCSFNGQFAPNFYCV